MMQQGEFLGEAQRQSLAAALRNQPMQAMSFGGGYKPPDFATMQKVAGAINGISNAGKNDTQQYVDEFGQFDPQMKASLGTDASAGGFFQGLKNIFGGQ